MDTSTPHSSPNDNARFFFPACSRQKTLQDDEAMVDLVFAAVESIVKQLGSSGRGKSLIKQLDLLSLFGGPPENWWGFLAHGPPWPSWVRCDGGSRDRRDAPRAVRNRRDDTAHRHRGIWHSSRQGWCGPCEIISRAGAE